MMVYNRQKAIDYAQRWALKRNPEYYDFEKIGGDCTNFVSQCIFSGCGKMNYEKLFGWYYSDINNRSPSWTGVGFLYKFLLGNKATGPFARECERGEIENGDVIQLDYGIGYQHSLIVTHIENGKIMVSAHTADVLNKPLEAYSFENARYLHIEGIRI